jgi:hypothetical protein
MVKTARGNRLIEACECAALAPDKGPREPRCCCNRGLTFGPRDQEAYAERRQRVLDIGWLYEWSHRVANIRNIFEYAVPVLLSRYAMVSLVCKVRTL